MSMRMSWLLRTLESPFYRPASSELGLLIFLVRTGLSISHHVGRHFEQDDEYTNEEGKENEDWSAALEAVWGEDGGAEEQSS
jgi:hypothetical protein